MQISDFSEEQVAAVQAIVDRHVGEPVDIQLADSDIQLDQSSDEVATCPLLFWTAGDCNFALMRTGEEKFEARFFYSPQKQFNTAQASFNTIEDCAEAVLQARADREDQQQGAEGTDINVQLN